MMTAKKKNVSSTFHASRTRVESSHIAHKQKVERMKRDTAQTAIIGVILASMLVVVVAVLTLILTRPERQVVKKIETLASEYYEKSLYKSMVSSNPDNYKKSLENYSKTGFTPVALRQLLLFNSDIETQNSKYITKYCDDNMTRVTFYPTSPYGEKDYHVEYQYACTF